MLVLAFQRAQQILSKQVETLEEQSMQEKSGSSGVKRMEENVQRTVCFVWKWSSMMFGKPHRSSVS